MTTLRWSLLALGTVALAAGWYFLIPPAVGSLVAADVRSVEVRLHPFGESPGISGRTIDDAEAIGELLAALRPAATTEEHKCASRGVLRFNRHIGAAVEVSFLPGHDERWYEYRSPGGIYRVSRPAFVEAMRRLGVDVPSGP